MEELNKNYAWLVTLSLIVFKNNTTVFLSLHFFKLCFFFFCLFTSGNLKELKNYESGYLFSAPFVYSDPLRDFINGENLIANFILIMTLLLC